MILDSTDYVLVVKETSEIIVEASTEVVLVEKESIGYVVVENIGNVVTDTLNTSVILTGLLGPAGIPEEDNMYSKRVDFISDSELYRGEALVGSSESSSLWRIRKITINPDVTELWASGNANFDKIWANRLSLNYS